MAPEKTIQKTPFKHTLASIFSSKKYAFLMLLVDLGFLLALWGVAQLNQFAYNLGISAASSFWVKLPYVVIYLFLLYAVAVNAKYIGLAYARKIFFPAEKGLVSQKRFMGLIFVFFALFIIVYSLFGYLFSVSSGMGQLAVFIVFALVMAFGMLWMYPTQWFLGAGETAKASLHKGLATFARPSRPLKVFLTVLLVNVVLFGIYFGNIILVRDPTLGQDALGARYNSLVTVWIVVFQVTNYIMLFFARMTLYAQNIPMEKAAVQRTSKRRAKK